MHALRVAEQQEPAGMHRHLAVLGEQEARIDGSKRLHGMHRSISTGGILVVSAPLKQEGLEQMSTILRYLVIGTAMFALCLSAACKDDASPAAQEASSAAQAGATTGAEEGVETGAEEGVETGAEEGVETGAEEGAKEGAKEGAQEGGEAAATEVVD